MTGKAIIKCSQLTANTSPVQYTGDALDLEVHRGRIIVLTGPDNVGKNDWLKTMGGIYYPTSGTISFFDKDSSQLNHIDREQLRKKLAYVSEDTNLWSVVNGLVNMMIPGSYHKIGDANQIKLKALNLISQLGVKEGLEKLPADMHKDDRFLLTVGRALMLDPDVLLLEKPFFELDAVSAKQFKQFLSNKVKQDNMTVIVSTQDCDFISCYADDIVFITHEKLFCFDNVDDFLNCNDSLVEKFIRKTT